MVPGLFGSGKNCFQQNGHLSGLLPPLSDTAPVGMIVLAGKFNHFFAAATARIPQKRLAAMAIPVPVRRMRIPKFARPVRRSSATFLAKKG
jgi:hypothetical protein